MTAQAQPPTPHLILAVHNHVLALPLARITDVFKPRRTTPVPLAVPPVAGLINLYGRILTAIDMRRALALPRAAERAPAMAVATDGAGESFALLVDAIAGLIDIPDQSRSSASSRLAPAVARVAAASYRVDNRDILVIDIDAVLALGNESADALRG
jgi:purine-binding chemotaxis protein CheW